MNVTLHCNFTQVDGMPLAVEGDKLGLNRPLNEVLNQCRPFLSRNRVTAEQAGEYGLVSQLRRKHGRKNQIDFIVLEPRQFVDEKYSDGVVVNTIISPDIVENPGRQFAWTLQFGRKRFN